MKFTVLICTYNRAELLSSSLSALSKCSELPDELVIVNGGDDNADNVVEKYKDKFPLIKLIRTKNVNLAVSRNVGLPYCTGDIIAMTDDDAEVFPDWVTKMKSVHLEHSEAGAIGGMVIGTNRHTLLGRMSDVVTFPNFEKPNYYRTLPGVNISYKKNVIDKIGLQDPTLFRGEDVDFNWRIIKLGYKIYYDPEIKVYHHHRPTLMKFLNQHYMYGRAYYLVRKKWDDMYCVYPKQLRTLKDFFKLINFFVSTFYEAISASIKMKGFDKIISFPIFFINQVVWKYGMIHQVFIERGKCK
jgi:GT2 family glycosyltransferase